MVQKRALPAQHNALLEAEHTPQLEILVERRRLGQTKLEVKPGQVGISNATKIENLGVFDYAHLRVPLPKDLRGSGIFTLPKNQAYPESYFLMRRSVDGYISATGMFKAAFPWATNEEEQAERKHHKHFASAGSEEVAGNVWISPEHALDLAQEYDMRPWIVALLDNEPIEKGPKEKDYTDIESPPKFHMPKKIERDPRPASAGTGSTRTRTRELRSTSPSKATPQQRKIASPRKRGRKTKQAELSRERDTPTPASSTLQSVIENGAPPSEAHDTAMSAVNGDVVRVEVDNTIEQNGEIETTQTSLRVDMPSDAKELPMPDNPGDLIETARKMVEEANRVDGERPASKRAGKRKAEEIEEGDGEDASRAAGPAKKAKLLEKTVKKERVKHRAGLGLLAAVVVGSAVQYFL